MGKQTFILSDETVNQYGFIVLTAGIKLDRFKENPVMLDAHALGLKSVIGKWENLRVEGTKLLADSEFDEADKDAAEISRKVTEGFIKGASVWVDFEKSDVKLDVEGYEGIPVVVVSELMEASIVSVPNNKRALKLSASGEMLEGKSFAAKLSANKNQNIMNPELKTVFEALGLTLSATSTSAHAVEAINALKAERDANKTKLDGLEAKLKAEHDAKVEALITSAIESKKLSAEKKDHYTKLAKLDFDATKHIIDGLATHTTISSTLGAGDPDKQKDPYEGKSYKELMASAEGSKYLAKLKAENKDAHKKLWQASFPGGNYNG